MVDGQWRWGIGDPTVLGWFTVGAHLTASWLCWLLASGSRHNQPQRPANRFPESILWYGLALSLVVLGLNKQLDLQTWLTSAGKEIAHAQGWYHQRRAVQGGFIICFLIIALVAMGALGWFWRQHWLTLLGVLLLLSHITIRAAAFNHVPTWIGGLLPGGHTAAWLELSGTACIGLSAANGLWHRRHQKSFDKNRLNGRSYDLRCSQRDGEQ